MNGTEHANPTTKAVTPAHRMAGSLRTADIPASGCVKKSTTTIASHGPIQYETSSKKFSYLAASPLSPYAASPAPPRPATNAGIQKPPITCTTRSIGAALRPTVATAAPSSCSHTQLTNAPPKTAPKTCRLG